jgi:hypothetical protein
MSFDRILKVLGMLLFLGLIIAALVRQHLESRATAKAQWYLGKWVPVAGRQVPFLELAVTMNGHIAGQFVQEHTPGYFLSLPVLGAHADSDQLLFAMESTDEKSAEKPLVESKKKSSSPPEPVLYVLSQRIEGQATLYRLKPPPSGQVQMFRQRLGGQVVFPTDLERSHEKVADLIRTSP